MEKEDQDVIDFIYPKQRSRVNDKGGPEELGKEPFFSLNGLKYILLNIRMQKAPKAVSVNFTNRNAQGLMRSR
jgi:hypothetical protein